MENNFEDLEKAFEALGEIMSGICTVIDEMADAISRGFEKGFSNFDIDSEIAAVKANPGLNWFRRKRRIRELKKLKKRWRNGRAGMTKIIKNGKEKVFRTRCRDCATDFSFELEDVTEISPPVIPGVPPLPNMPKMRVAKCPVCQADVPVDLITEEEWDRPYYGRYLVC